MFFFALASCQAVHVESQFLLDDAANITEPLVDGELYDPNTSQSNSSIAYLKGMGGCTATLIAPQVLLTAGHCAVGSGIKKKTFLVAFPAPLEGSYRATHTIDDYPIFVTAAHDVVSHPAWNGCVANFKNVNVGDAFVTQCADGYQRARGKLYLEDLCDSMRRGVSDNARLINRASCETVNGHWTEDGMMCALLRFSIMLQPVNRDAYRGASDKVSFDATYALDMLALRNAIIPAQENLAHSESVRCTLNDGSTSRVGFDIALVKLDTPMPSEVRPERVLSQCSVQQIFTNTPVFVAGFGATVTDILWRKEFPSELDPVENEKPFGLHTGTGRVDNVSEHLLAIQGGRFYSMPGQCPGDSGGPVMLEASEGNRRIVAGVASTSRELYGFCLLGAEYTRVQVHSAWIENTVASFRDEEIRAHPENTSAITRAFAMESDACGGGGMIDEETEIALEVTPEVTPAVTPAPKSRGGCNTTGSDALNGIVLFSFLFLRIFNVSKSIQTPRFTSSQNAREEGRGYGWSAARGLDRKILRSMERK